MGPACSARRSRSERKRWVRRFRSSAVGAESLEACERVARCARFRSFATVVETTAGRRHALKYIVARFFPRFVIFFEPSATANGLGSSLRSIFSVRLIVSAFTPFAFAFTSATIRSASFARSASLRRGKRPLSLHVGRACAADDGARTWSAGAHATFDACGTASVAAPVAFGSAGVVTTRQQSSCAGVRATSCSARSRRTHAV